MFIKSDILPLTIIILSLVVVLEYIRMDYYEKVSNSLESELNLIKVESDLIKKRYGLVNAQAADDMKQSQKEVDAIMASAFLPHAKKRSLGARRKPRLLNHDSI